MTIALFAIATLYLSLNASMAYTSQWVGISVWLISGTLLFGLMKARSDSAQPKWVRIISPYAALTVAVLWTLYPAPFELPLNQDHAHHYFANTVWVKDVLLSGHIFGWSDRIAGGLPLGDVYGTPVYIITSALYLVTFGLVSMQTSYAAGIVAVWLLLTLGVAALTRRLMPNSQIAPLVAGLATLWDPGGDREAGWLYAMFHAVWPQLMGTAVLVWATVALLAFLKTPTLRRFGGATLLFGACVWMHPMNALNLAILAPTVTMAVIGASWNEGSKDIRGVLPWLLPLFLTSGVIAFGYFAHMLSATSELAQYSAHGPSLRSFAAALLQGSPFSNGTLLLGTLGLIGLITLIRLRTLPALLIVSLFAAFVLVASMDVVIAWDLGLVEWLPQLMYRRFLITAKPFWFAMVGVGAAVAWSGIKAVAPSPEVPNWAFAIILGPLALALAGSLGVLAPAPVGGVIGYTSSGIGENLDALRTLLVQEKIDLKLERPVIVDWSHRGKVGDYELVAIADAGYGYLATRKPPCQALATILHGNNLQQLRFLGATHLVSRKKREFEGLKLVGQAGPNMFLYRFKKTSGPPAKLERGGELKVKQWSAHKRVLEVSGKVTEKTRLILGMPPYSKWTATQNGKTLALDWAKRGGFSFLQTTPEVGEIEITFEDTRLEVFTFIAALLAAIACWMMVIFGAFPLPRLVPERFDRTTRILISGLAVTFFAVMALVVASQGDKAQARFWLQKEKAGAELLSVLHREPADFNYSPRPACMRSYSRNPQPGCVESDLFPRIVATGIRSELTPTCLEFGVIKKGASSLRFPLPEGTDIVKGHWSPGRKQVKATMKLGKNTKKLKKGAFRFKVEDLSAIEVNASNTGKDSHGCLEVVAVRAGSGIVDKDPKKDGDTEDQKKKEKADNHNEMDGGSGNDKD